MSFFKSMIPTYEINISKKAGKGYTINVERTFFGQKFVTEFSVREWEESGLSLIKYIKSKY